MKISKVIKVCVLGKIPRIGRSAESCKTHLRNAGLCVPLSLSDLECKIYPVLEDTIYISQCVNNLTPSKGPAVCIEAVY